ncbi:hypothetical protein J2045_002022 [Peteryoungia aggregata LMG 23059]|uniref:Uncharacterized protein n=1 Tax=Peteryoungia aggregata LMG 23059 TaxID=1368425 RepID=A0ABU0G6M2_9HYPH|nr:hypothetical protein [Peteryoungia aggregata]MDQ0420995.1 hypothetical protein [Peteryoungia aggregata LMG 23059]
MLEKLIDLLTSDKVDGAKLHIILILLGSIVVFFAEKIPLDVAERGVVQIAGFIVLIVGLGLLFISTVDRLFRVSTLGGLADGILSGLVASSFVSILFFAPSSQSNEEDFFLYRIFLVGVYGMLYGGLIGTFTVFFVSRTHNIYRFFSASLIFFVCFVWGVSSFVFPRMPVVESDPITMGEIYLMHVVYIVIFTAVHSKGVLIFKEFSRFDVYIGGSVALIFVLAGVKVNHVYPVGGFGDERIWSATFYVDYKPSYYLFGLAMVVMFMYASLSIVRIFHEFKMDKIEGVD